MKCFNCRSECKTIYPKFKGSQYVAKMCLVCGWKSHHTKVPCFTSASLQLYTDERGEYLES